MTEHQPQQARSDQTPNQPHPPPTRRNTPLLLAGGAAVILLVVGSVLGGYLWGHQGQSQTQRDLDVTNAKLIAARHDTVPIRSDLQNTKFTLDSIDRTLQGCQDANRVLLVQVSRHTSLIPRL